MTWLITGGAGYIGSHVVAALLAADEDVVVLDDLSTGDARRITDVPLVEGSVLDGDLVARTMQAHRVSGVVHLAGKKQVEESTRQPLRYWRENVEGLRTLLSAAEDADVASFVFSSSAAVYGAPDTQLVHEDTSCVPVNPYGATKLAGEWLVQETAAATGMRYASLRYFNVAGARDAVLADRGASNLIPMVFERLATHRAPLVFGADYDTPDGTCIRDFVHVSDLADAHVTACRALTGTALTELTANVGTGTGASVREVLSVIAEVTGTAGESWAYPEVSARRAGDPARVVACVERISTALGWRASHDLRDMVESAWNAWSSLSTTGTR